MRSTTTFLLTLLLAGILAAGAYAQTGPGNGNGVCEFIDEDGDGFNDLAPDADGDGIPNGMDPDYVRPEDGSGNQYGWGRYAKMMSQLFGEGRMAQGEAEGGNHFGPGEGTGLGDGPFGPGGGDGDGDGDGDRAQRRGGGKQ